MRLKARHLITGLTSGLIVFVMVFLRQDVRLTDKDQFKKVRILCWIMTGPQNLDKKAVHVKRTWGRRCNVLLFMSSVKNNTFPTVGLNTTEGRDHLLAKTIQAFRYVYKHHFNDADWFMKADDDTYVIMENLRQFLFHKDTRLPVFFGRRFRDPSTNQGYFTGGAGYVLSKESLKRFAENGHNKTLCEQDGRSEDIRFAKCLQNLGIRSGNTTDSHGRNRFHQESFETNIMTRYPTWFNKRHFEKPKRGVNSVGVDPLYYDFSRRLWNLTSRTVNSAHEVREQRIFLSWMSTDRLLRHVNRAHNNMGIDKMWILGRETLEERLAAANNFHPTINIITYDKHVLLLDNTSHLEGDRVYNIVDSEAAIQLRQEYH